MLFKIRAGILSISMEIPQELLMKASPFGLTDRQYFPSVTGVKLPFLEKVRLSIDSFFGIKLALYKVC